MLDWKQKPEITLRLMMVPVVKSGLVIENRKLVLTYSEQVISILTCGKIIAGQRERSPDYQKLCARFTHIWGNRRSQPNRSAMEGPRPGGPPSRSR